MNRSRILVTLALVACSSKDDKPRPSDDLADIKSEAAVEWARKELPDIDARLASSDPGRASSTCAVIKPDMAKIKKADPELAAILERKCGRDLAVRSMTIAVERAEKDHWDCSSIPVYEKSIAAAGAGSDPEVIKLRERVAVACAKK